MKGDLVYGHVLCVRIISQVDQSLSKVLNLRPEHKSILILTSDLDDVAYISADYATKMCNVTVVYGTSMYAGSANATSKLAGECILILAGPDPEEMRSAAQYMVSGHREVAFVSCNEDNSIVCLAHCISRAGTYLSGLCGLPEGSALAYCVAPPAEAIFAADAAAKAADIRLVNFTAPPSNTNYAGTLFTGTQAACQAACQAYLAAVQQVAEQPILY